MLNGHIEEEENSSILEKSEKVSRTGKNLTWILKKDYEFLEREREMCSQAEGTAQTHTETRKLMRWPRDTRSSSTY